MNLESITFLDIETVSEFKDFDNVPGDVNNLFVKRNHREIESHLDAAPMEFSLEAFSLEASRLYAKKAGLYAEFGKVVCIAIGKLALRKFEGEEKPESVLYVKTIVGDEKEMLIQLAESLEKSGSTRLCAHNGKDFDFPFLMRRYIIHGLPIPKLLAVIGKKPWETHLEDTMEMWSGSQWKYRVSLDLLANILGIPSPKTGITGSDVGELYYGEDPEEGPDAMEQISQYCTEDVIALAKVYARIINLPITDKVELL
jgi:3'-5' exonuclease